MLAISTTVLLSKHPHHTHFNYRQLKNAQDQKMLRLKYSTIRNKTQGTPSRLCGGEVASLDLSLARASEIPPDMIEEPTTDGVILGKGRFGTCKKVLLQGTPVCAKAFLIANSNAKLSLLHEAAILLNVRHPNIACIVGVQTKKEPFQLLMINYSILGASISIYDTFTVAKVSDVKARVLETLRPRLQLEVWLAIMKDLATALSFIHSKSIIHRDLKSDNAVLHLQSDIIHCVLVDFGKSTYRRTSQKYHLSDTEKEEYRCNHKHIAPDLVDGVSEVSTASDVYSYGRILKNIIHYFPLSVDSMSALLKKAIKQCLSYKDSDRPSAEYMSQLCLS